MPRFLALQSIHHAELLRAMADARAAFARFDAFIESELLPRSTDEYGCGADVFDLLLKRAHFVDLSADELEAFALERLVAEAGGVAQASDGARDDGDGLERFGELWAAACELAERHDLLTVPDWPVRYVEQPVWVREAAPFFYFLPYRSPAPFDHTPQVEYFVPPGPIDAATVKLNHVLHHGSPGHHVQNWRGSRASSRIGQMAADCASRIAMLCGGSMAEGWACYAVDLAEEAGFLTDYERAVRRVSRQRMAARAVVDVRLHRGSMSLDEAARLYVEHAGMSPRAAPAKAVKNSLFPGAACMYLIGWDGIRRLRAELEPTSLRDFHDQLLSFGSIPVSLVSRAMRQRGAYVLASP